MSLLDDVSIVVTPNGYKAGVLFSVIPSSGAADLEVIRQTAATRVDENGLVNYAEVIGGEEITGFTNGTSYPFSTFTTSGNNITSAIISSSFAGAVSNSISIVNGKTYKVTFTYTKNSGDDLRVLISNAISGAGSSISNIEQVSVSGDITLFLIATSTTTGYLQMGTGSGSDSLDISITNISVKEVTRDNVPRIDYTGGGCPHILAEPMRTNLIPYSEEISQYNQSSSTASDNETISPDGTNNASKISKDGVNANDRVTTIITISNSTDYSLSAFIKNDDVANGGVSTIGARITGGTVFRQGYEWNGSTLSVTNSSQSGTRTNVLLEDYGNGWWKVGFSFTSDGTEARLEFDIDRVNGTDTTAIFLWAVQTEAGSYGTSYIPNFGTALGVTRNQDIFTRDGIGSLINSTEGVLFAEMAVLSDDSTLKSITLSDGTGGNRVIINYSNASNRLTADVRVEAVGQAFMQTYSYTITNFLKIALKYKENDFALWVNGTEVATDTSGSTFSANTLNRLGLDNGASGELLFGKVKQLQVYKTALTDAQLTSLTT